MSDIQKARVVGLFQGTAMMAMWPFMLRGGEGIAIGLLFLVIYFLLYSFVPEEV